MRGRVAVCATAVCAPHTKLVYLSGNESGIIFKTNIPRTNMTYDTDGTSMRYFTVKYGFRYPTRARQPNPKAAKGQSTSSSSAPSDTTFTP